jgi:hypothetical protein
MLRRSAFQHSGNNARPSNERLKCTNNLYTLGNLFIYTASISKSFTYDHRRRGALDPVCSPHVKPSTGGLVVRWVTTGESPLLYVFVYFISFCSHPRTLSLVCLLSMFFQTPVFLFFCSCVCLSSPCSVLQAALRVYQNGGHMHMPLPACSFTYLLLYLPAPLPACSFTCLLPLRFVQRSKQTSNYPPLLHCTLSASVVPVLVYKFTCATSAR